MAKFLDDNGLLYFWQKIKAAFVAKENGKGLSANDYTSAEKTKLSGIAAGATAVTVDATLSNTSTNAIQNKAVNTALGGKVDKVDGKGLSTNDYTTTEKTKLSGIAGSAQVNILESVKVNGIALPITSKAVNVTVPTKVSDITNDSGFITGAGSITGNAATATKATQDASGNVITTTYAKIASPTFTGSPKAPTASEGTNSTQIATTAFVTTAVATAIGSITQIRFEIVEQLPATGQNGVIYLLSNGGSNQNSYDEYIYVNSSWEKIGTTDVDLSGYWAKADLNAITNAEIDVVVAS